MLPWRWSRAWQWGAALVLLASALRLIWVLAVPTVPVSDFAMYRESANFLSEFGRLDPGFIYMPGFVVLLALVKDLGGDLLAQKMIGVVFGGLGAAGVFGVTLQLFDRSADAGRPSCKAAIIATLMYALWPAGIAMSSVVGTDVPAAALMLTALACLTGWAADHPRRAALTFGVVMGLAAYMRAVALPLTALAAFFWLAQLHRLPPRRRLGQTLKLTALSVAATLVLLLPWALRNQRRDGELFFTDSHGGLTALIGANPNSEGTYTRALNQMFREVTGRSVLDEPHRQVDRAAYAMAVEWTRFQPAYALGLAAKRADRLFDRERRLLYWPITRPGVLIPPHEAWFEARRAAIDTFADAYGAALLVLFLAGIALGVAQRRPLALTLVPFQLALAATYIIFFAEPRYRIPVEMMAFPVAAAGLLGLVRLGTRVLRRDRQAIAVGVTALAMTALLTGVAFLAAPALVDAGARLRLRHRWAVALWTVDGRRRISLWARTPADAGQNPTRPSPLEGALDGVRLRWSGPPASLTQAAVTVSGGDVPPGAYRLTAKIEVQPNDATAPGLILGIGGVASTTLPPGTTTADLTGVFDHPGGRLHLLVSLQGVTPDTAVADVWISGVTVARL
ncbi:MAG TPA: hypothetical protein VFH73_20870 [Polyangia bacterium]|nr:hypothetical protein [Polyangia bacterium]